MNKNIHKYRFALYGASGSGKTVFLAALAMNRENDHPEYTCTRIPLTELLHDGKKKRSKTESLRLEALHEGKKWLDTVVVHLSNGQIPPPNPPDHPDMIFEFELSTKKRSYRLEFIDYAGELVHSTQSANESASRLRRKIKDMDALLVLAPAPWPENDHIPLDEDLLSIRETFMLLRDEREEPELSLPVALLFDKWDRRSELEYHSPDNEHQELREFLEQVPPPPHKELLNAIKSSVIKNNFSVFPVSALGECKKIKTDNGQIYDGPPDSFKPLHSFGLEEPLVWAAERRDQTDILQLGNNVKDVSQLTLTNWRPWPFSLWKLDRKAKALAKRFPDADPDDKNVNNLLKSIQKISLYRTFMLLLLFTFTLLTIETTVDSIEREKTAHTLNSPQSSEEQIEKAVEWLKDYTESPFFRHSVSKIGGLSQTEAEVQLNAILKKQEKLDWNTIYNIPESTDSEVKEKLELCELYLNNYDNGDHRSEVENIKFRLMNITNWRDFKKIYNDLKNQCKILEAADFLMTQNMINTVKPMFTELKSQFEPWALLCLDTKITNKLSRNDYKGAQVLLNNVEKWPPALRTVKSSLFIKIFQIKINRIKDQTLYDEAKKFRDTKTMRTYINECSICSMKDYVVAYLNWLEGLSGVHEVSLVLSEIRWGPNAPKTSLIVLKVYKNGKKIFSVSDLDSKKGRTTAINRRQTFKAKLDERFSISADAIELNLIWPDKPMGNGVVKKRIRDMKNFSLPIRADGMTNYLDFRLVGLPEDKEPKLPKWEE